MNKAEREKLRKFDIAALADLLPAERSWGERISPAMVLDIIIPFLDHIDALEGQVEEAYREGYTAGSSYVNAVMDAHQYLDEEWINSKAKAAIANVPEVR